MLFFNVVSTISKWLVGTKCFALQQTPPISKYATKRAACLSGRKSMDVVYFTGTLVTIRDTARFQTIL